MTKAEIVEKVKDLINAPSCYAYNENDPYCYSRFEYY